MSLWTCLECTARRAVGMLHCPQCGHGKYAETDIVSPPVGVTGARQPDADRPDDSPVAAAPGTAATGDATTTKAAVP